MRVCGLCSGQFGPDAAAQDAVSGSGSVGHDRQPGLQRAAFGA